MESKLSYFFARFNTKFCKFNIHPNNSSFYRRVAFNTLLILTFLQKGGIFKGGLNSLKNCLNAETP